MKAIATEKDKKPSEDEMNRLLRLADKGDKAATATLRETFEQVPKLWANVGNMAGQQYT